MSNSFLNRNQSPSTNELLSSSGGRTHSFSRFSFHKQHSSSNNHSAPIGSSPKNKTLLRYSLGGNPPSMDSLKEHSFSDGYHPSNTTSPSSDGAIRPSRYNPPARPKSSGLRYALQVNRDLSSIDKINDPEMRLLIVAGKSHLGLYKFQDDYSIVNTHDFMHSSNFNQKGSSNLRRVVKKISVISDVKAGFYNHKNYVAICGTSTSVSVYDINKTSTIDNPLVTTLSEHTRSINSVDFNMSQTNLLISGGQDGCIKVWDLRSSQRSTNRSDININTGSDSIRDIKWMPSYDFATNDANNSNGISNRGFKFASIHDSGLLLKFDLRQPNQVEKKINAHSGPGLCLHWHPHQEYIISGGRDGKCCLWYVGDKNSNNNMSGNINNINNMSSTPAHQLTPGYSINTTNTSMIFPEMIINTAHPLSKLKFRPQHVKNVMNSLIAMSSLGEDSDVSIYSLSRRYIPKNVLSTPSPSSGFVWWDENLVFAIEKQNIISGWDIAQEPTLLDNLPKSMVGWRDIDGDGLLFVDQHRGSYETADENVMTPDGSSASKISHHRMSTATLNSFFSNSASKVNPNSPMFSPAMHSIHNHSGSMSNERPLLTKSATSISNKYTGTVPVGSFGNHTSLSHHNSVISTSNSMVGGGLDFNDVPSPQLISLDLPQIINRVRISKLPELRKEMETSELTALKESPVEVFKFLARELKFSYMQEKNNTRLDEDTVEADKAQSIDDAETKKQLMEKFGIAENNTWTNLIRRNTSHDAETEIPGEPAVHTEEESLKGSNIRKETNEIKKIKTLDTDHKEEMATNNDGMRTIKLQERINHLIELVSMCDHNAETYLYIKDLMNFKLWIMMRDALLWELKEFTDKVSIDMEKSDDDDEGSLHRDDSFADLTKSGRRGSTVSDYSSFNTSEFGSSVGGRGRALSFISNKSDKSGTGTVPVSNLKLQLDQENKIPGSRKSISDVINHRDSRHTSTQQSSIQESLEELRRMNSEHIDESAIDEDEDGTKPVEAYEEEDVTDSIQNNVLKPSDSIPITQNRRQRTSFIDTFITNLRSPGIGQMDLDNEIVSKTKSPSNLGSSAVNNSTSTNSKRSPLPSVTSSCASLALRKSLPSPKTQIAASATKYDKNSPQKIRDFDRLLETESISLSELKLRPRSSLITGLLKKVSAAKHGKTAPPWDTERLVRKIYEQSVQTGNILLTINILLLFQTSYKVTSTTVVKNTLAQFITILHHYELFETAADLLKYCPWDDILGIGSGQSTVRLFCDRCGKLIINEPSKERLTLECRKNADKKVLSKFGYWYCDLCSKPNSLCVFCERPVKKLAMCVLNCGHEGHFECFKKWFLEENMQECPGGCLGVLF